MFDITQSNKIQFPFKMLLFKAYAEKFKDNALPVKYKDTGEKFILKIPSTKKATVKMKKN